MFTIIIHKVFPMSTGKINFLKKMKRPAPCEADLSKNIYGNRKNAPSYAGAFGSSVVFSAEPCAICSVKVKQLPCPGSLVTLISSPRCFIIS